MHATQTQMSATLESPKSPKDGDVPIEPVETRVLGYKDILMMMNSLSICSSYSFPEDKAGNKIIPGDQFSAGRNDVRITQTCKNTWVVDYKDVIMAVEGKLRHNAGRTMDRHMEMKADDESGKTVYEGIVEDLDEDESKLFYYKFLHKSCLMNSHSQVMGCFITNVYIKVA